MGLSFRCVISCSWERVEKGFYLFFVGWYYARRGSRILSAADRDGRRSCGFVQLAGSQLKDDYCRLGHRWKLKRWTLNTTGGRTWWTTFTWICSAGWVTVASCPSRFFLFMLHWESLTDRWNPGVPGFQGRMSCIISHLPHVAKIVFLNENIENANKRK